MARKAYGYYVSTRALGKAYAALFTSLAQAEKYAAVYEHRNPVIRRVVVDLDTGRIVKRGQRKYGRAKRSYAGRR
jgi:hypothetical protein